MICNSSQDIFTTTFINNGWYKEGGQVTKSIIVVKMSCELLYIIQVKGFSLKSFDFLALLDIRVFGRL